MSIAGFYINLDKSTARNVRMREQLEALSLLASYCRFPAVDGASLSNLTPTWPAGEAGCLMSHLELLRQNISSTRHLHVMEDDAILSQHAANVIERITVTGGLIEDYDIIMTNADVGRNVEKISLYKKIVDDSLAHPGTVGSAQVVLVDISKQKFACTSSYLVNRSSIRKICGFLEAASPGGTPIDLFLRALANNGHLRIGVTMPFVTSVPLHNVAPSTIHGPSGDYARLSSTLIRRALYLDCDPEASLTEAGVCHSSTVDGREELILAAFRLCLSPNYMVV